MLRRVACLFGCWVSCAALAQSLPVSAPPDAAPPANGTRLHASYQTYAAGLHLADVQAGFRFGPSDYRIAIDYHTTGVLDVFYHGHQFDQANGAWEAGRAVPAAFIGQGEWGGVRHLVDIAYNQGKPEVRRLLPPDTGVREPVPDPLQANAIDGLSALAQLIHVVAATGRCDLTTRTYDGRRVAEIESRTVGEEDVPASGGSGFAGKALHCDFSARVLAGFRLGDDSQRERRPMHGAAWFAPVVAGGPPVPVRVTFGTRWFGEATMVLTGIAPGVAPPVD
jgi:hypothetical protein